VTWSPIPPSEASAPGGEPIKGGLAFRVGLVLIVVSNGVYLLYFLLPFLPVDTTEKAGLVVGFSLASWGIFSLGIALAGRDGVTFLWQAIRRLARRSTT